MTQNYKTRHAFKRMFFAPWEATAETDSLFSRGFWERYLGLKRYGFQGYTLCVFRGKNYS